MTSASLSRFAREHMEWVLTGMGLVFMIVTGCFLAWGVMVLARSLGSSLATPQSVGTQKGFDVEGAAKLDLRGLE